jgi:Zn-dependent protease
VTPDLLVLGLTWFVVFLFSTTLHEAAHAFAAYRLGDPTAYQGGQVSLNPLPHIQREPVGMLVVPLITFVAMNGQWMMGWASAPYDPTWAQRHPRRAAIMALAGPFANLLLALTAGLLIWAGRRMGTLSPPERISSITNIVAATDPAWNGAAVALSILFSLNVLLCVFNLLPLPPLDGSAVLPAFLSDKWAESYRRLLYQPMISLLGLVVAWQVFPSIYWPIYSLALRLLYPDIDYR